MSTIENTDLRELLAKATPGPWVSFDGAPEHGNAFVSGPEPDNWTAAECFGKDPDADAALIAALRNAAPDLLRVVEAVGEMSCSVSGWDHLCIFCNENNTRHEPDCIWVLAHKLVGAP